MSSVARLVARIRDAARRIGRRHAEPGGGRGHVLVVEDTPTDLDAITGRLRAEGFRVTPARSAHEALRWLQRTYPNAPELVLQDLVLSDNEEAGYHDGLRLLERLRTWPPTAETPIVVISRFFTDDRMVAVTKFGAFPVEKSATPSEVMSILEEAITRERARRATDVASTTPRPRTLNEDWYA